MSFFKKIQRVAALFMVFAACTALCSAAELSSASEWAIPELREADALGLISPEFEGKYQHEITRAAFVSIYMKAYALIYGTPLLPADFANPFSDTDNLDALRASYIRFVSGTGNGNFSPDMVLTRAQLAVLLAMFDNGGSLPAAPPLIPFADLPAAHWGAGAVCYVNAKSLMLGTGNDAFAPDAPMSYEQSLLVLARFVRAAKS